MYATDSYILDLNIKQFQDNLQQGIQEQVQSSINNTNCIVNDCEGDDIINVAILSQSSTNGQSSSICTVTVLA